MQFIEALKLRSKLFFLFLLITMGLVLVGVIGSINLNSMKKNLDSLYFGSLVPVTELNEILQVYHVDIANTIYKAKNSEISSFQTSSHIQNAILNIGVQWKNYVTHFKRDEELQYVEYAAVEIKKTNAYFKNILDLYKDENSYRDISIDEFNKHILHIHEIIKKLINYESDIAKYERNTFLQKYNSTLIEVGMVLLLIILTVLVISYYVFKSIQNDQTKLETTTKKLKSANKKLENMSYTDSLTSLHNRRYFNFIYDRELNRAKRAKSHITFMMLDIDFFKQYNDTYGHIEGDFALKSVAKALKDTLQRPSDFVFRLGGEEFGVLLTDSDEKSSAKLAQSICDVVKGREILHKNSSVSKFVTISVGVVCCKADDTLDENVLISLGDKMLYEAKENGRDCFVMSSDTRCEEPYDITDKIASEVEELSA